MTRNNALTIIVAALVLGLAAAACGGNGNTPSVAGAGGATTTNSSSANTPSSRGTSSGGGSGRGGSLVMGGGDPDRMRKLASCIRAHGVPNFPDPDANGSISVSGINPDSPSFKNAMDACQKFQPNGGKAPSPEQQAKMQAAALKYSACMRAHGVPNFPDPQFSGGRASLRINKAQADSPNFRQAQQTCAKDLPGKVQSQKAAP